MPGGRAITPQMAAARRLPLTMTTPRIALIRRPSPLDVLLSPIKKMVAWEEPWDVEDDEDEAVATRAEL